MYRQILHFFCYCFAGFLIVLVASGCDNTVNDETPEAPGLLIPVNDAADVANSLQLVWDASAAQATVYDLQVTADSPDFTSLLINKQGLRSDFYELTDLEIGQTYHWRVRAINEIGSSDWSEPRRFTPTLESIVPGVPLLSFPADSTQDMPEVIRFTWQPVQGATHYQLQVSIEGNFIRKVANLEYVRGNSQAVKELVPTYVYYWRVRAASPLGFSPWSPKRILLVGDHAW